MFKSQKIGIVISTVMTNVFIIAHVVLGTNLSPLVKLFISLMPIIGSAIGLAVLFSVKTEDAKGVKKVKVTDEKSFGLTEKLYSMTLFTAMAIYLKGIWEMSPASNPAWIKHIFFSIGLLIFVILFLYVAFKKVHEQADERFYANLAKAACSTLVFIVLSLMFLSVITFLIPFTLSASIILIYTAILVLLFDLLFYLFEKRG